MSSMEPSVRAQRIAIVHQRLNLPFQLNVEQFILMGRYSQLGFWGQYAAQDHLRVEEEMDRMKVQDLRGRNLDEISGGELQKVLLARALCQDTEWLLLDEPGQQLDPKNRKFLYDTLTELSDKGKKIICSTHDREAIESYACQVVGMRDGEIAFNETGKISWEDVWEKVYR